MADWASIGELSDMTGTQAIGFNGDLWWSQEPQQSNMWDPLYKIDDGGRRFPFPALGSGYFLLGYYLANKHGSEFTGSLNLKTAFWAL